MELPTRKMPKIQVGTNINAQLWDLAKKHNLNWSDALDLGIRIQLAEKGVVEYPNTLMKQKFNQMRVLYEKTEKEQTEKELDVIRNEE